MSGTSPFYRKGPSMSASLETVTPTVTETDVCTMAWCDDAEGNKFCVHART